LEDLAVRACLLLEDGTFIIGHGHGEASETVAEVVFNTAMTGYEEVLTDPSYCGQIVVFTTSHLGNTGFTQIDSESKTMCASGMICRELTEDADSHRAVSSLGVFLKNSRRMGISGVDTRLLAQKIRARGCMKAIVSATDFDPESLRKKLIATQSIHTAQLVRTARQFTQRLRGHQLKTAPRVVAVDCGMKKGILDGLIAAGLDVHTVGPDVSVAEVMAIRPDGLFFSNGPGSPQELASETQVLHLIRTLSPRLPTFGICLGHQLIALAFGGKIGKLGFGHHAVNHPVVSLIDFPNAPAGRVMITSQNHNYHVIEDSVKGTFIPTHRHLNDSTLAGMQHCKYPIFSVQFHPECNPGPQDAQFLFSQFARMIEESRHARTL
jgi:carbamoyl-phosphate synthase small subunit